MPNSNIWLTRWAARGGVGLMALLLSQTFACSYLMVAGPAPQPPPPTSFGAPGSADAITLPPLACMRQKFAPYIDTGFASLFGVGGAVYGVVGTGLLISELGPDGDSFNRLASVVAIGAGLIGLAIALPWYYSARSGFRNVAACRAVYALRGM